MSTKKEFAGFALDAETQRKLKKLAKKYEGNKSLTLRILVRDEYDRTEQTDDQQTETEPA